MLSCSRCRPSLRFEDRAAAELRVVVEPRSGREVILDSAMGTRVSLVAGGIVIRGFALQ